NGSTTAGELAGAKTSSGEGGASGLTSGAFPLPPGAASKADETVKGEDDSMGAVSAADGVSAPAIATSRSASSGLGGCGSTASVLDVSPVPPADVSATVVAANGLASAACMAAANGDRDGPGFAGSS